MKKGVMQWIKHWGNPTSKPHWSTPIANFPISHAKMIHFLCSKRKTFKVILVVTCMYSINIMIHNKQQNIGLFALNFYIAKKQNKVPSRILKISHLAYPLLQAGTVFGMWVTTPFYTSIMTISILRLNFFKN